MNMTQLPFDFQLSSVNESGRLGDLRSGGSSDQAKRTAEHRAAGQGSFPQPGVGVVKHG